MLLTVELAPVGPTRVAQELGVSTSTAYRDLALLEEAGFVASGQAGHRSVTDAGLAYLDAVLKRRPGSLTHGVPSDSGEERRCRETSGDPIWEQALDLISQQVNEGTFRIWFEPTVGLGLHDGVYSVGVASDFARTGSTHVFAR